MDTVKIAFSGRMGSLWREDNFIRKTLEKKFKVELSDRPDFLFYSIDSKDFLDYSCVRIFYTAENLIPDFNVCDYAIGFHYIDFEDRYIRYPIYMVDGFTAYKNDDYASDLQFAIHKHENVEMTLKDKTEFCAFVYSNQNAAMCREVFFETLSLYKRVNSGGRYKNNVGGSVESKLDFQRKHKFVIAFENTSTPGYTTEKLIQAFAAGAIPIYWGDPEVTRVFNPKAFINCHEYGVTAYGDNTEAFKRIVEKIKELDSNDTAYIEMLSQPAFNSTYDVEIEQKKFEEFLFHIVEQKGDVSFRRNRYYWGERYERKQKIGNKFYWLIKTVTSPIQQLKGIFKS